MGEREPVPITPQDLAAIASEWQGRACFRIGPDYDVVLQEVGDDTGFEGMILRRVKFRDDEEDTSIVLTVSAHDGEKIRLLISAEDLRWVLDNPVVGED